MLKIFDINEIYKAIQICSYIAFRPIYEPRNMLNMLPMNVSFDSSLLNGFQVRGGSGIHPSTLIDQKNYPRVRSDDRMADPRYEVDLDSVVQDLAKICGLGLPVYYTGRDCTFRLKSYDFLQELRKARAIQQMLGCQFSDNRMADKNLLEQASFIYL